MNDRVKRGLWNGGHILGYRSAANDKGKLILEVEGSVIIHQIFDWFEELGSASAVTRKLNELGIRYPTFETRSGKVRGGKPFAKQMVIRILQCRIFLGEIHWGEVSQVGCHEPIISEDQFNRVQHRLGQSKKKRSNFRKAKGRRYLLSGLLRCQCGAHMVGAAAHGRAGVYHYYVCTKQGHEGGKYTCRAPRLPAEPLEHALLERLRELGTLNEAREQVVRRALECLDKESGKLKEEEDLLRRHIARLKVESGRLLEVLKSLGANGLVSVQDELQRLELEEKQLRATLSDLQERQKPMDRVSRDARAFIETWSGVGDLLDQVTPDERFQILQHYVEVLELQASDGKGRDGKYILRLFPEVRPHRISGSETAGDAAAGLVHPPSQETPNGAVADAGNDPVLLTENSLVRISEQKAPRSKPSSNFFGANARDSKSMSLSFQ